MNTIADLNDDRLDSQEVQIAQNGVDIPDTVEPERSRLDLWSTIAARGGGIARMSLVVAQATTNLAFQTAKASTRLGLGIAREVVKTVAPVGIDKFIDVAEFFAILGIEIGEGVTHLSLSGSSELVRVLQQFFGDKKSLLMAYEIVQLLSRELVNTGVHLNMYEVWKYFSAWISMQNKTKLLWRDEFIWSSVVEYNRNDHLAIENLELESPGQLVTANQSLPQLDPVLLLSTLRRYSRFANAIYGERVMTYLEGDNALFTAHYDDKHFYAHYAGIDFTDIRYLSRLDQPMDFFEVGYVPAFCVSMDHEKKAVVLAFRGTISAKDTIVDLYCEAMHLSLSGSDELYYLHGGMLKVVTDVSNPDNKLGVYHKVKQALEDFPEYSLVITGHSLGAGLASILGMAWADPVTCQLKPDIGFRPCEVKVYAFACPSIMETKLALQGVNLITTVAMGWDWLARISYDSVIEIRDAIVRLKSLSLDEPTLISELLSTETPTDDRLADFYRVRREISLNHLPDQSTSFKLHPPGRIIWLYFSQTDLDRFTFYDVYNRANVFGEILFDDNSLNDHYPTRYDQVLESMEF
ncbi:Alpha/Beta hydrolase protein [Globomyces pollinis-pini]|nr:Alpha/Beta hydrolase protein [Globomyces pollinis-pini]